MADEKKIVKKSEKKKGGLGRWFREMRSELKKVVWPSPAKVVKNTSTVILCSLGIGVFIWVFDYVAALGIKTLLGFFGA